MLVATELSSSRLCAIMHAEIARRLPELRVSAHAILGSIVVHLLKFTLRHMVEGNHRLGGNWLVVCLLLQFVLTVDGSPTDVEVCHLSIHSLAIGQIFASRSTIHHVVVHQ